MALSGEPRRVCLLTGASGRLGSAFLRLYGHRYDIFAVSGTRAVTGPACVTWQFDPLKPAIRTPSASRDFASMNADLTDAMQVSQLVQKALARFGRIDLVVNAAAVVRLGGLTGVDSNVIAGVTRMFEVNTVAPLRLALEVARQFWRTRAGENAALNRNIVNVSSTSAAYVFDGQGQGGYSASKAALNMLTCHMAEEFAELGVRVNAVAPDSFPERISTESVCDAIVRLDQGAMNGAISLQEMPSETVA
jgi:NAD(P)-dependent dehydrogenase (short-subunit alcohol dehydrogenase family)